MRRVHADLILLACAAVWGFAFLFQKSATAHVGPLLFVAARALVAALALAPLAWLEHRRADAPVAAGFARMAAVAGAVFVVAAVVQQAGIVTASVINTGFLTALYVVATPFAAWALMRRRPAPLVWGGVVLSFAGTWLLGGGGLAAFGTGDALVAASVPFWAVHLVLLGGAAPRARPILFTAAQFAVAGLLALAAAFAGETVSVAALAAAWREIVFVGVMSSALTFTLFTLALRHATPTEAAVIVSTDTVFAALGAYVVLGERVAPTGALGAVLILAATLVVQVGAARVKSRNAVEEIRKLD